jgi:predicted protein tyrosine phosphatase
MNVLFVCSRNKKRSPTAEAIFSEVEGMKVASAGTAKDAEEQITSEHIDWANLIFVMESCHKRRLTEMYKKHLKDKRIVCLNIKDRYEYMDDELVALLRAKVNAVVA